MSILARVIDDKDKVKLERYYLCRKLDEIIGIDIYENYTSIKNGIINESIKKDMEKKRKEDK